MYRSPPQDAGMLSRTRRWSVVGTSSSQRSPSTPEWERVRELFRAGNPDPDAVSRGIADALSPQVRSEMSGPGVAACLDTMLQAVVGGGEALAREVGPLGGRSLAALARTVAERRIARAGAASRLADIALDALGAGVVETLATSVASLALSPVSPKGVTEDDVTEAARCFMRHDMSRCFSYFVSRDLSELVGTPVLPDVDAARRLVRGVSDHCRRAVDRVEPVGAGDLLPAYLEPARSGRGPLLSGVLEQMVRDSLDAIATGTGEDR